MYVSDARTPMPSLYTKARYVIHRPLATYTHTYIIYMYVHHICMYIRSLISIDNMYGCEISIMLYRLLMCVNDLLVYCTCAHTHAHTHTHTHLQLSLDSGRAVISSHHTINLSYTMNSISLGYDTMNGYYEGCLAGLTINDHQISLSEAVGASNESNSTSNQFLNTTTDSLYYETETIGVEFGCGMGSKCSDLATPTCPANSVCIDEWRSHSCVCDDGLIALEETGECVDPCDPNPCQNGGSCIAKQDGPKCMCVEGYTGPTCIQLVSTSCPIGHYGPPDCKPCYCHLDGVTENVCDSSGRCFCNVSRNCVFSF